MSHTVRPRPCATCPYRRDVPSGVWAAEEYAKLPKYDGSILEQVEADAFAAFHCHSSSNNVCAGWAGHRNPSDLLAVHLGIARGQLDPAVAAYRTDVPLFESGAAAAAHGLRSIDEPDDRAVETIAKLIKIDPTRLAD